MSLIPVDYEKQYLELLNEHRSEETLRYRRNLTTFGFLIIASWFLELNPKDIDFGGIDLSNADSLVVAIVSEVVMGYWLLMYTIWLIRDTNYNKVRGSLLESITSEVNTRYESVQKQVDENKNAQLASMLTDRLREASSNRRRINMPVDQLKIARTIQRVALLVEKAIPYVFGVLAVIFVFTWIGYSPDNQSVSAASAPSAAASN